MTIAELQALAQSDPAEFVKQYEQHEADRRAARRAKYAANPTPFRAQAARWRDAHRGSERERVRKSAERVKALRDAYKQLTEKAA